MPNRPNCKRAYLSTEDLGAQIVALNQRLIPFAEELWQAQQPLRELLPKQVERIAKYFHHNGFCSGVSFQHQYAFTTEEIDDEGHVIMPVFTDEEMAFAKKYCDRSYDEQRNGEIEKFKKLLTEESYVLVGECEIEIVGKVMKAINISASAAAASTDFISTTIHVSVGGVLYDITISPNKATN